MTKYAWFNVTVSFILPESTPEPPNYEDYADSGVFEKEYDIWYDKYILPFYIKLQDIPELDEIDIRDEGYEI